MNEKAAKRCDLQAGSTYSRSARHIHIRRESYPETVMERYLLMLRFRIFGKNFIPFFGKVQFLFIKHIFLSFFYLIVGSTDFISLNIALAT